MKNIAAVFAAALGAMVVSSPTLAHPHVWVTVTSQVLYDAKGAATGVRHAWKFDDMYSTFAVKDLTQETKGTFTREELAPLAKVNIDSLKESDFFTYAKTAGIDLDLGDASDYWLDYKDEMLTLNFTVSFKKPQKTKDLIVEVYDPTYFVAFGFADKDGVALVGPPAHCKANIEKVTMGSGMNDTKFISGNLGAASARKIRVKCP
jgi:ABC-type uncharacterized transport system substrate-binding protein